MFLALLTASADPAAGSSALADAGPTVCAPRWLPGATASWRTTSPPTFTPVEAGRTCYSA